VRVAEGDPGAVMGVLDSAVRDAELVQARGPGLQLIAVAAGERNMIQAGAVLVESVTCGLGVGMQAEQLPSAEREHGVVKAPGLLVLVQDRLGGQQPAIPAGASLEVSHGHSDMGDRRELRHGGLLIDGERLSDRGYPARGGGKPRLRRTRVDVSSSPCGLASIPYRPSSDPNPRVGRRTLSTAL